MDPELVKTSRHVMIADHVSEDVIHTRGDRPRIQDERDENYIFYNTLAEYIL